MLLGLLFFRDEEKDQHFRRQVKDLFQRDRPTVLLDLLTGGIPVPANP